MGRSIPVDNAAKDVATHPVPLILVDFPGPLLKVDRTFYFGGAFLRIQ